MQPPPPPISKPGRVRVYQAIQSYISNDKIKDEISLQEDDIIYVTERFGDEKFYSVSCDDKIGLIPRSYVDNEECAVPIEFPLQNAAKRGNAQFLLDCLKNNMSVNVLDRSGSTALYWAAHTGHAHIVNILLEKPNISVSSQNKLGDTPLHGAAYKNRVECVKMLVEAGADPHMRNNDMKKPIDMTTNAEVAALLRITMNSRVDENAGDDYDDASDDENNK